MRMNGLGRVKVRPLLYLIILVMVAEVVIGGDPSSSTDNANGATAMSKAFATSTKLSETNYMIWYAGILTVLLGVTIEPYARLMKVLAKS